MNPLALALAAVFLVTGRGAVVDAAPTARGDRERVARLRRLPDARDLARAEATRDRPERDVDVIQGERVRKLDAAGRPYRSSMPFRDPPRPCSTGIHRVAHVEITVVLPADGRGGIDRSTFEERELHEVEAHGAPLSPEQRAFLDRLPSVTSPRSSLPSSAARP